MNPLAGSSSLAGSIVSSLLILYGLLYLTRLGLQLTRADYFNPVSQFILKLTDPLVKPLNRVIPPYRRLDLACLLIYFLLTLAATWVLAPGLLTMPSLLIQAFKIAAYGVKSLLLVLILANVILSWVGQSWRHPIIPLIYKLSEPLLQPIRRFIRPIGGFDFSPIIALLLLQLFGYLIGLIQVR